MTVGQLIATKIGKLGENIAIARFVRLKVGDTAPAATEEQRRSQYGRMRTARGRPTSAFSSS